MSDAVLDHSLLDRPRLDARTSLLYARTWPRVSGRHLTALLARLAIGLALLVGAPFGLVAAWNRLPAAAPAASAPLVPAWREIVKPVRIYNLEAPAFAGAPVAYTAKRHTIGGGREDVLALGTLDGAKLGLRLRMFRRADEAPLILPLYAALAHEAAQVGLSVGRIGLPDVLPTRFGRLEVADVALADHAGAEAPCSGFRLILDAPALTLAGLACGPHRAALARTDLGCLIERLDVAAARDDRALIDFFAASELRRNAACAGMRLGPDGLHAAWLDEKPAPVVAAGGKPATSRKRVRRR